MVELKYDKTFGKCEITAYVDEHNTEYYADCSYLSLTDIPNYLPPNISCLNMVGNKMAHVNSTSLQRYKLLRKLSLAGNDIHTLRQWDFDGMSKLEMLDLSLNHIRYTDIHDHAFKPLNSLVFLDIKQNLSNIWTSEHYPKGLKHLLRLQTLAIDGLGTQVVPYLPNLTELYMSGAYGRCDIPYINRSVFENVSGVRNMFLSNCNIRKVNFNSFKSLKNLTSLDMSLNINLGIESLPNITSGLTGSQKFKQLNLNTLYDHSVFDFCSSINKDSFKYLTNTSIELLTIENNNIVRMDIPSVGMFPRSIKYISVQHNMFLYGNYTPWLIISGVLNNLVYVDISRMSASNRPIYVPDYNKMNQFSHKSKQVVSASDFLPLCNSMFTRKKVGDYFQEIENRLKQNNIDSEDTRENSTVSLSSSKLEYLDLTENLPVLIERFFEIFPKITNLKVLNISKNYLGYPIYNNTDVIGQLINVQTLDLSGNRIMNLQADIFSNLTKLKHLHLSRNLIDKISFDLRNAKNLSFLDLEYNKLESIDKVALDWFDKLPNVRINIANNNLKCTCENINFLLWVERNENKLIKMKDTFCTFENSSTISIATIDYERLHSECSDELTLIMVPVLLFLVILISGVCAAIYKHRSTFHNFFNRIRVQFNFKGVNDGNKSSNEIYIIYVDDDRDFVLNDMINELEEFNNLRLVIEDREQQRQGHIFVNVGEDLQESGKILIVLTDNCKNNGMYYMKINMAFMEQISTGKEIFIIRKGNCKVPIECAYFISPKYWFDYPADNREEIDAFWEQLRIRLAFS